ncbi:MAG: hypothetical protein ACK5ZX_08160 [Bacteroidota bacterium]|jgi:hypothetical protein
MPLCDARTHVDDVLTRWDGRRTTPRGDGSIKKGASPRHLRNSMAFPSPYQKHSPQRDVGILILEEVTLTPPQT